MTNGHQNNINFTVDNKNLYREESFTDLKVAAIRRLTPVTLDGSEDESRKTIFIGQTTLMSPEGPLPLQSAISASNLEEAISKFPESMGKALEHMINEARKSKEKEDSRIIVPGK